MKHLGEGSFRSSKLESSSCITFSGKTVKILIVIWYDIFQAVISEISDRRLLIRLV